MTTWVLVAHRAGARLFDKNGRELSLVASIENDDGRRKDQDFEADRPGRTFDRHGPGRHSKSREESPKERAAANFARTLARRLEKGRVSEGVTRLLLVAEPHFLGMLRNALDGPTSALVDGTVTKDLAQVADRDVADHLAPVL